MNEIFFPLFGFIDIYGNWEAQLDFSYFERGTSSNVWFNNHIDEFINRKDELAGFFHTHPSGMSHYSQTDFDTMQIWCDMLGKDLLCLIGCPEIHGWWFSKSQEQMLLGQVEEFNLTKFMLKGYCNGKRPIFTRKSI